MTNQVQCPVTHYAQEVLVGKIAACELVKLACWRHLDDLEKGPERGLFFDAAAADRAIRFFPLFLRHSKGEWAGKPFKLEPWQQFIVGQLFGWKRRADGLRRFRTAYTEVPRKNGKSTLAAGIGLLLTVADKEAGAEVYSAATKRDQARIVHGEAVRMGKASPELSQWLEFYRDNINFPSMQSKYEPLGADADTMDGLNVHGAIIDELHAHKTRAVVDVLETATSSRRQPLIFEVTTAGWDPASICREHHDYTRQILQGSLQDDTWFGYISSIDEGDDWLDPAVWAKANPNYNVSVKPDDLTRKAERARQVPGAQNAFMRLHLNIWTQQAERWIDLDLWDANKNGLPVTPDALSGRTCYGGLDLAAVSDLIAWVMVFPRDNDPEMLDVLARFWCPEARLQDRQNRYREQYQVWERQGYLTATPGDAVDYAFVRRQILEDAKNFRLVDLNVDRLFQAHQLAGELQEEGLTVFGMGQGFMSMASPTNELERRLLARKINHGGNPVLRWMADNVAVKQDAAGNRKPDKAGSQGKIDGIVALIMAIDRAMRHREEADVGIMVW